MARFIGILLVVFPLVALFIGGAVRADSIRLRSGETCSIDYAGAKIVGI